jgi:sugar phosphate isomerase/epimerase
MRKNQSRRDFLRISAAGAVGAALLGQYACKTRSSTGENPVLVDPKSFGLGLQLYTIRDAMAADVLGSLKRVSELGIQYLELAGYSDGKFYGYAPIDFKDLVAEYGMEILSSHTQVEAQGITLENATKMAEDHAILGVKYCIQPWIVEEARTTIASYQKMAADWNKVGEIMKNYGIQFGYHNHNFEFDTIEGKVPYYDVLLAELDPSLVTMELDLFWATKAGQNPVEMFKKYPNWFQLFHMKDMYTMEEPFFHTNTKDFAPVGEGHIDFKTILSEKETAGMKYMIIEQDHTMDGRPFEAIEKSVHNLTTDILV